MDRTSASREEDGAIAALPVVIAAGLPYPGGKLRRAFGRLRDYDYDNDCQNRPNRGAQWPLMSADTSTRCAWPISRWRGTKPM